MLLRMNTQMAEGLFEQKAREFLNIAEDVILVEFSAPTFKIYGNDLAVLRLIGSYPNRNVRGGVGDGVGKYFVELDFPEYTGSHSLQAFFYCPPIKS